MTEEQWLDCVEPRPMLETLRNSRTASERKFRLLACAIVRRVWALITDARSRCGVEATEGFAEGLVLMEEWIACSEAANVASHEMVRNADALKAELGGIYQPQAEVACHAAAAAWYASSSHIHSLDFPGNPKTVSSAVANAVRYSVGTILTCSGEENRGPWRAAWTNEATSHAPLIRCIFANPFRPFPLLSPSLLAWNGGLTVRMANAIYQERSLPEGTFDVARIAILADALEDAGAEAALLDHLRGPGPHVRGCFVIDLLTGREGGTP